MHFHSILVAALALGAGSMPLGTIEERTSPVPPLWDGAVDFEKVDKVKRGSPVPPLWDGGIEFEEMGKDKRGSPVSSVGWRRGL
ncbi:hypothetical protein DL767_000877 [Monosporascus sp. MG133]|nr:hypothetical protein DL767_000877 [Monosporascus sp. MG133]